MTGKLPRLLTFAPMIDSELSRLVLRHHRVAYEERDHLFAWVSLLTLFHGGYGRVPLLYGKRVRLTGPRPIAEHYDAAAREERKLIPLREPLARGVELDWVRYNGRLAFDTAAITYFHLLPACALMTPIFAAPLPRTEARLLPGVYGPTRTLFKLLLRLNPAHVGNALARVRIAFDRTDERLADGRPYLAGDRLTLSDLSLISAAAPLLLPDGYGARLPPLEQMPSPLGAIIVELRRHPTADFVQRVYRVVTGGSAEARSSLQT
ncbi:MAG: hypothetical protein ACM3YM_11445 [Sphingomonadales bacterium]